MATMVNISDIPELMPGAHSRANPADRERFERRCLEVYREDFEDDPYEYPAEEAVFGGSVHVLQSMFPSLDVALVQAISDEAPTQQHAIDFLLMVSGSEPPSGSTPAMQRDPTNDDQIFPALIGSNGWQVPGMLSLECEGCGGLSWRDRVSAAANRLQPKKASLQLEVVAPPCSTASRKKHVFEPEIQTEYDRRHFFEFKTETDYDHRQRRGRQRAENRKKYGRKQSDRLLISHRPRAESDGDSCDDFSPEDGA